MKTLSRRNVLAGMGAGAVISGTMSRRAMAQNGPIKIGLITSLSGPAAILAKPQLLGGQMAVDEINKAGGINGRQVELLVGDDKANANDGIAMFHELQGKGANLFCGLISTAVALGSLPVLKDLNSVLITCAPHGTNLTHEAFVRNYFRITDNVYMRSHAGSRLLTSKYPDVTDWGMVVLDLEFGREMAQDFRDGFAQFSAGSKNPVKVRPSVLAKFGNTDFKNQIVELQAGGAPGGIVCGVYGADEITFITQGEQLGLIPQTKVIIDGGSEIVLLKALGKRTPKNFWVGSHWYYGAYQDLALGKSLYDAYVSRTGDKYPTGFVCEGYSAILAYANAIKQCGTNETQAVIKTMEGMTFDTPKGSRTFRKEDHQAICDVNYMLAQPSDDEMGFKIVDYFKVDGAQFMDDPSPGTPAKMKYL